MDTDALIAIVSKFSDQEKSMLRWLVSHFHDPRNVVSPVDAAKELGIEYATVTKFFEFLEDYGLVRYPSKDYVVVLPKLLELSARLDTLPPRDYPREAETRFRSTPVSLIVYGVIAVGAVIGAFVAIIPIFKWLGF